MRFSKKGGSNSHSKTSFYPGNNFACLSSTGALPSGGGTSAVTEKKKGKKVEAVENEYGRPSIGGRRRQEEMKLPILVLKKNRKLTQSMPDCVSVIQKQP